MKHKINEWKNEWKMIMKTYEVEDNLFHLNNHDIHIDHYNVNSLKYIRQIDIAIVYNDNVVMKFQVDDLLNFLWYFMIDFFWWYFMIENNNKINTSFFEILTTTIFITSITTINFTITSSLWINTFTSWTLEFICSTTTILLIFTITTIRSSVTFAWSRNTLSILTLKFIVTTCYKNYKESVKSEFLIKKTSNFKKLSCTIKTEQRREDKVMQKILQKSTCNNIGRVFPCK
jgi:hypothetical protein